MSIFESNNTYFDSKAPRKEGVYSEHDESTTTRMDDESHLTPKTFNANTTLPNVCVEHSTTSALFGVDPIAGTTTTESEKRETESRLLKYIEESRLESDPGAVIPVKLPHQLKLSMKPFEDTCLSQEHTVEWRVKPAAEGESRRDGPHYESNTNLVQWSDGSWTLVVDDTYYGCRFHNEGSYLANASNTDVLVCSHAPRQKLVLRPLSLSLSSIVSNAEKTPKSTQLTPLFIHSDLVSKRQEAATNLSGSTRADEWNGHEDTPHQGFNALFLEEGEKDDAGKNKNKLRRPNRFGKRNINI